MLTRNQTPETSRAQRWLALLLATLLLAGCGATMQEQDAAKEASFHYKLAVNHFGANEATQAIRELTLALQSSPDHAEALHLLGFIYMGRKQYPEAIRNFRRALELKPDYYICKNNLGVAYLFSERWHEAAEIFEELRTATLYTSPWLAYANLGWAYYKQGRIDDAIEQTKMALFLEPEMCLAANNLGMMYADRNEPELALASLEEAAERCPSYAEPHLHMGHVLADAGDLNRAQKEFRKCMDLSPKTDLGQRCKQNARMYR